MNEAMNSWLYREDLYKMKEKTTEKKTKICPKCGAYYYLRDCSCGWKIKEKNDARYKV